MLGVKTYGQRYTNESLLTLNLPHQEASVERKPTPPAPGRGRIICENNRTHHIDPNSRLNNVLIIRPMCEEIYKLSYFSETSNNQEVLNKF